MRTLFRLILLSSLFGPSAHAIDTENIEVKIWVWTDSSQIQITHPSTQSTALFFFEYDKDKAHIRYLDWQIIGESPLFSKLETGKDLLELLNKLPARSEYSVFLYGPRQVDPLGPQPGDGTKEHMIVGGKKEKTRAIFPTISWSATRAFIKSDYTQTQIDFLLFQSMISDMIKRDLEKTLLEDLRDTYTAARVRSCNALFAL